jgi:LemA protein
MRWRGWWWAVLVAVSMSLSGCGYNDIHRQDAQVKAAWSPVLNQ